MPETAIVTIQYEGKEQDYSLPLTESIGQWLPVLGKSLRAGTDLILSCEGKELLQTASLAEQHVWEGAVLTLSRR